MRFLITVWVMMDSIIFRCKIVAFEQSFHIQREDSILWRYTLLLCSTENGRFRYFFSQGCPVFSLRACDKWISSQTEKYSKARSRTERFSAGYLNFYILRKFCPSTKSRYRLRYRNRWNLDTRDWRKSRNQFWISCAERHWTKKNV